MMSESRFTCAVQTEEAAHGAQTGHTGIDADDAHGWCCGHLHARGIDARIS